MKNGRLAMLAWVGFAAQALATGRSPLQDWDTFLADPEKNNLLSKLHWGLPEYPGTWSSRGRLVTPWSA